jgi:peptidoglycan hydrolase-like amidase
VPDPYDSISPHHTWRYRFTSSTLALRLGVPSIQRIVERTNSSGRIATVAVRWSGGRRVLTGLDVQQRLQLPSTWFRIRGVRGRGRQ